MHFHLVYQELISAVIQPAAWVSGLCASPAKPEVTAESQPNLSVADRAAHWASLQKAAGKKQVKLYQQAERAALTPQTWHLEVIQQFAGISCF